MAQTTFTQLLDAYKNGDAERYNELRIKMNNVAKTAVELTKDPNLHLLNKVDSRKKSVGAYTGYYVYGDYDKADYIIAITYYKEWILPVIVDKDVYESGLKNQYIKPHISGSDVYARVYHNGYDDRLHRVIMGVTDTKVQVDHVLSCTLINVKEFMRVCTQVQNGYNSEKHYGRCQVRRDKAGKFYFRVVNRSSTAMTDELKQYLADRGYTYPNNHLESPHVDSQAQVYQMIQEFEAKYYNGFGYNPLYDLSNSFYLGIMYFITKQISFEEVQNMRRFELTAVQPQSAEYLAYYGITA